MVMRIGTEYEDTVSVVSHSATSMLYVTFPVWTAGPLGTNDVLCRTLLDGDNVPENDTISCVCYVDSQTASPFNPPPATTPPPEGDKMRRFRNGSCVVYLPPEPEADNVGASNGAIYVLKGNSTTEFWRCDLSATGSVGWVQIETIPGIAPKPSKPGSFQKKKVGKGATLSLSEGRLYATKGSSSSEFWQYDPSLSGTGTFPWRQLEDVPMGGSHEGKGSTVKDAASAAAVVVNSTPYIYFLKGSATLDFYRFNTLSEHWEMLPDAPGGRSGKTFKAGSSIVYYPDDKDGAHRLFALKGGSAYNEFHSYNFVSQVWTELESMPRKKSPYVPKKIGAGSAMSYALATHRIFALKGNKTTEC